MSKIVDATGAIICPKVRAKYERISGMIIKSVWGREYFETRIGANSKFQSGEAYLRLVLRLEAQGKWDYETADLRRVV